MYGPGLSSFGISDCGDYDKGLFSRITFREPVFLGGYGNITGLDRKLPVSTGFTGCIRKFVANDHDYNFQQGAVGDVSHGFDIRK
uniref:LAM_G_DOMAIN domain-containing protein n=1 Tax=Anopheles epiroticus TaxID=199890 RepID=A0A182PTF1_9DIPT